MAKEGGNLLINVYDLIILLPLWIERNAHRGHAGSSGNEEHTDVSAQASGSTESGGGALL